MAETTPERASNFIRVLVEDDLASNRTEGRVATRFPPEPNGYLHIGHAKSICLNFGLAEAFGGTCNLRFDDTNPEAEDEEFVGSILRDVRWLGFEPSQVVHASDYFEQIYSWAEQLVVEGKAYVDEQSLEEIRATRGTVTEAGSHSPWRDRAPEENLRILREMRAGKHADGSMVLRAKADMASPNMKMRDPLMYRIRKVPHHRTGDAWCIYPMYDWAHGQSDAIEGITHSICTLEFQNNRELYDWFLAAIGRESLGVTVLPTQTEFARLGLNYTMMSKRRLKQLVAQGIVDGWDDPRMPTISGLRRRGVTPEALRGFCERIGVAKANSTVDVKYLDWSIRDDLNHRAPRRMAVLDPLEVELTNYSPGRTEQLDAPSFPPDVDKAGSRAIPFGARLFIERGDFAETPPSGWHRLAPGGEVRLRYAYVMKCEEVVKDDEGHVVKLRCSVDHDTLSEAPKGRRVRGTIHWVPAHAAVPATVNMYDRLFNLERPNAAEPFEGQLNPDSLVVVQALVEPAVAHDEPGVRYQFERHAYVYRAPEDADKGLVFNRTIGLRDSWSRQVAEPAPEPVVTKVETTAPTAPKKSRAELRAGRLAIDPPFAARFARYQEMSLGDDDAETLAHRQDLATFFEGALQAHDNPRSVANFTLNRLMAELKERSLADLPFTPAAMGALVGLVDGGAISSKQAKKVWVELLESGGDPAAIVAAKGMAQISDPNTLGAIVDGVLAAAPDEVARYRAGEHNLLGFFVGQVMKASRGKAEPRLANSLLREKLS